MRNKIIVWLLLLILSVYAQQIDWPVSRSSTPDWLNSTYGMRWIYDSNFGGYRSDFHRGIDIAAAHQTYSAIGSGQIVDVLTIPGFELTIIQQLDGYTDMFVLYAHNDNVSVVQGQVVSRGEMIGTSGDHLHLGLLWQYPAYPPYELLEDNSYHPLLILPFDLLSDVYIGQILNAQAMQYDVDISYPRPAVSCYYWRVEISDGGLSYNQLDFSFEDWAHEARPVSHLDDVEIFWYNNQIIYQYGNISIFDAKMTYIEIPEFLSSHNYKKFKLGFHWDYPPLPSSHLKQFFAWQAPFLPLPNNAALSLSYFYGPTYLGRDQEIPREFKLGQNYPNPFNPNTAIPIDLIKPGSLVIYNALGQEVFRHEFSQPGHYLYQWNGRDNSGKALASGVYIYRLEAEGFIKSMSMQLIK